MPEAALTVLSINVFFGYWRANTEKLSIQWFLAIHVPVPITIAIRFLSNLGWSLITFPVLIAAFFSGQLLGGKFHSFIKNRYSVTSCLVMDVVKIIKGKN
ncbi:MULTISPECIES: hypothetical protein [unclassified Archaeoglobus]|jgi:hypothetical protein|uniref:hypothetical protein n=1 Tax=unclassified Archaeoglobus TaxID=2643606 RepID=UPI0025C65D7D|nr:MULTISPECIES: hypothetical protein [unclassified Archaeoglobus]